MGKCKICGNNAGLFKDVCSDCRKKEEDRLRLQREEELKKAIELEEAKRQESLAVKKQKFAKQTVQSEFDKIIARALVNGVNTSVIETEVNDTLERTASNIVLFETDIRCMLFISWDHAVELALNDHILSETEENRLDAIANFLGLREIESRPVFEMYQKGKILRILSQGQLPTIELDDVLPIPLASNERLVYKFDYASYSETVTESHFVGGSNGVSVRLFKGVSYRVGGFRGHTEKADHLNYVGCGTLFVTTKHIAFVSSTVSIRIPFTKIAGFTPMNNGFAFYRTNKTAKPEQFVFGEGWFPFNLVSIVSSTHFDVKNLPPNLIIKS